MAQTQGPGDAAIRTAAAMRREPPFGAPYVFVFAVIDGQDASVAHRIVLPETVVGRGEECHLTIEDDQVSREHCRIRVEGPVCSIVDAGSRNGTRVNGRRIVANVAHRLRNLDEIGIGSHRFILMTARFQPPQKQGAA